MKISDKICANVCDTKSCSKDINDMSIEELNEKINANTMLLKENDKKQNEIYDTLHSLREAKEGAYQAYVIKNNVNLVNTCLCNKDNQSKRYIKILSVSEVRRNGIVADIVSVRDKENDEHVLSVNSMPIYLTLSDIFENKCTENEFNNAFLKAIETLKDKVSVDTKKDLLEVCGNICSKAHSRFRDEIILAQKVNAKLIILIEEAGIDSIDDVFRWQNPRMYRYNKIKYMHERGRWQNVALPKAAPTSGQTLAKAMLTLENKYGCKFMFCKPSETAERIVEILSIKVEEEK